MKAAANFEYEYKYMFRYMTFIADKEVPAKSLPLGYLKRGTFEGDNRGFNFNAKTYRTWVEKPVIFSNSSKGNRIETNHKKVGLSVLYKSDGGIMTKRASSSGIKYSNIKTSSNKITYIMNHEVGIPFGVAPEINYEYDATVYKSGQFKFVGSRDQAPHHEFYGYMANTESNILKLIQKKNKSFNYLILVYPNADIKFDSANL